MSHPVAVTVVGTDRPGIVAAVSKALFELGCNLEDATSTILRGHFSMVLIVSTPDEVSAEEIEGELAPVAQGLHLVITARPVEDVHGEVPPPTHMVSVYGSDKPGIVYRVAESLARAGANITDLTSRLIGSDEEPVYALMLEVAMDAPQEAETALAKLKDELGVDITVHPIESDLL